MITIWSLSGIYQEQDFYKDKELEYIDLTELPGTNCYCDDEAKEMIRQQIQKQIRQQAKRESDLQAESKPPEGGSKADVPIHFTDSGNYHYMSLFFQEMIDEDYVLCLWDNHPDLQEAAFGGITSCGGWVKEALDTLPHLKQVLIMGVEDALIKELEPLDERVTVVRSWTPSDRDDATKEGVFRQIDILSYVEEKYRNLPVYLSIDKDLMEESEIVCNWSQGITSFSQLKNEILQVKARKRILGIDTCGECDPAAEGVWNEKNNNFNNKLLGILT